MSLGPRLPARSKIAASPVPERADDFIGPLPGRADDFIGLLSARANDFNGPLPGSVDDIFGPLPTQEVITIPLIDKASDDLQVIHDRTGLSRTDIVNRAISLYAFIDAELRARSLLIVRRQDGKDHLIKLL